MDIDPNRVFIETLQRKYASLHKKIRTEHDALMIEYPYASRLLYFSATATTAIRVCVGLCFLLPTYLAYMAHIHWIGVMCWCVVGAAVAPWNLIRRIDAMWNDTQLAVQLYQAVNYSSVLYAVLVSAVPTRQKKEEEEETSRPNDDGQDCCDLRWVEEQLDELRRQWVITRTFERD